MLIQEFKDTVAKFAIEHASDIRKDPIYRSQFQKMCAQVPIQ